ncbi:MAG: hypothetical protein ACTSU3_03470 [Candidatus Thorarchaeota archaeon]
MSEDFDFKMIVRFMSAIALAIFYLVYLPWTYLSAAVLADPMLTWVYYFTLVIGLLFPMYYAIEKETMAWICLGLSLILNSVIWMVLDATQAIAAVLVLIVGVLFFLGPFLKDRVGNWDLIRNLFHFLKGLFLVLAIAFFANFNIDAMIGNTSANHIMPQFLFLGGGIMVAFAVCLMVYGLFNIFKMYLPESIGGYFGDLAKIFYMLMVLSFLIGITFNVITYAPFASFMNYWAATLPWASGSLGFFAGMANLGTSNLGAILLIILFIYGMAKIAKKFE